MVCQLEIKPKWRILTWPNAVTVLGMALAVWAIALIAEERMVCGLFIFVAAALTDFADGWLARAIEARHPGRGISRLGAALDPIRDKMLIGIVIPLSLAGGTGLAWPIALIVWEAGVIFLLSGVYLDEYGLSITMVNPVIFPSKVITLIQSLLAGGWFVSLCFVHPLTVFSVLAMSGLSILAVARGCYYWAYRHD